MSGIICSCDSPVRHLGLPNCSQLVGIPRRLIFVPTFKDDGTRNYIDTVNDAIGTAAFWNGKQYNTDESARFFPLPKDFEAVEMAKADSVYEEFPSGAREFVRDGERSFMGVLPKTATPLIGKLKSKGCAKHSVYIVDHLGNLVGIEETEGLLYPMQLKDSTLNSIFQFATDTTVPKIVVQFQFSNSIADEEISYIRASDIYADGAGINLFTQFNGVLDTKIAQLAGNRSATTFTADIYTSYGDSKTKIPVEGLVTADFTLYNVTDAGSLTLTSATESTSVPGRYAMVISASQTTTDILRLGLSTTDAAKQYDDADWYDYEINLD